MGFFKSAVLLLYNTLLLIVHLVVFAHLTYAGLTKSFDYHKFFGILIIITCSQYLDIFLSLIKFTNSNPVVVFTQVTGRLFVLYVATHVDGWVPVVFFLVFIYLLSELCRGPFYVSICLGEHSPNLAWLRYNAFKVLYPIGFTCEALVFSNVFYQGYLNGAFVSAIGVDYYSLVAFFGIVFFGYIVIFLFGTMSRQARKKSKLWEKPRWKHQYMTEK